MAPIRLPGSPAPGSPLLADVPRPRRRVLRSLVLLLALAAIALVFASHSKIPASLEPLKERIVYFRQDDASLQLSEAVAAQQEPEPVAEEQFEEEEVKPKHWSEEDQQLRKYRFKTPEVHESLERRLQELSPEQRLVREWLRRTRSFNTGGTGVGLDASDPPRPIRPAPRADRRKGEGPGELSGGSQTKFADLEAEWKTGRPADVCGPGAWQDEYAALHADMLSGKREPHLLEFTCRDGDYCGGIADRLLGMVTTFLYSLLTNRAFCMTWEQPAPLDMLFDSPFIDWSRPFSNSSSTPVPLPYSDPALVEQRRSINAHNWEEPAIDEFFPRFVEDFGEGKATPWLQLDFNRGVVIRSFSYPSIRPHLDRLGLKLDIVYSCLINYLLRPKAAVLDFIAQYSSLFALPEFFVVGIQVRTGDQSMWATRKDTVNTVSHHSQYFRCAAQVAATYAHPSQKVLYYLATDSRVLEEDALKRFPDQVVVTGLKPAHVEIKTDKSDGLKAMKRAADGFMRTVAENWIFAATDFQILTYRSGFGKLPTWLRGRPNTTVQLLNPHMDPVYTRMVKKKNKGKLPPVVDCTKPEALKSFSDMAQDWSLG
ncbi:hypothetical protein JCM6882_007830 [Rhodosporidiobolus microsporus]